MCGLKIKAKIGKEKKTRNPCVNHCFYYKNCIYYINVLLPTIYCYHYINSEC